MLFAGRLTFQIQDWMKLPPGFGASEEEYVEFSIHSMDEVINSSMTVMSFCRSREQDERRSIVAGLCVEEMAGNVIEHGFLPGEKHSLDIRVVAKDKLTIRLRDDCPSFNPKKRLEQYTPQDPTKNIGIRLIVQMAEEMNYQNSAGINTLLIKV
jgi:anti-sigma regulatory factor (Ser/Thr protein kinase)